MNQAQEVKIASDKCVRVAIPLPVKETFHYLVPEALAEKVKVGCRVRVPFGRRQVTGYVLSWDPPERGPEMKVVLDLVDSEPLFPPGFVPFFEWISEYYLHPIGQVVQSALPGGLTPSLYRVAHLTETGRRRLGTLPGGSEEREVLEWILGHPGRRIRLPLQSVSGLHKKGWITLEEKPARPRAGPLLRRFLSPSEGITLTAALDRLTTSRPSENEAAFLRLAFESAPLLLSEIATRFPNGRSLAQKWVRRGFLRAHRAAVYRDPAGKVISPSPPPPTLSGQQEAGLREICAFLDSGTFQVSLLFGVTGSGKTEVYYSAITHAVRSGRKAILLVPEIALAVYMEGLFRSRLGERVAVYHSGLSDGERYDEWMRMKRGEVDLVIGARSALFSPLPNLGLIVVDEEHDPSYKQDTAPRYQARDGALVRGKMERAVVVLGSGTPSLQSYKKCREGRYALLTMPERVDRRPLPDIEVVDLKEADAVGGEEEMMSPRLAECLGENLSSGNQALLFLNRRGYHRVFLCRVCGRTVRCPNCEVGLTYHLKEDRLTCHYCGYFCPPTIPCPSCGGDRLRAYGFGTERLELEIGTRFPGIRVARMDTDSVRRKGQAFQILKRFSDREVDVLVGTQMITKGYDFPHVTLVGRKGGARGSAGQGGDPDLQPGPLFGRGSRGPRLRSLFQPGDDPEGAVGLPSLHAPRRPENSGQQPGEER
jgi:primosomal protein N' (replication factor Y)